MSPPIVLAVTRPTAHAARREALSLPAVAPAAVAQLFASASSAYAAIACRRQSLPASAGQEAVGDRPGRVTLGAIEFQVDQPDFHPPAEGRLHDDSAVHHAVARGAAHP